MGFSATAHVFYGIPFGNKDNDYPWDEEGLEFDEWWLKQKGHDTEELDWKEQAKLFEKCPIEIIYHGYHEESEKSFAVKGTEAMVDWGETLALADHIRVLDDELVDEFKEECERLNLKHDKPPQWYVVASYG